MFQDVEPITPIQVSERKQPFRAVLRAVLLILMVVTLSVAAVLWLWARRMLVFSAAVPVHITSNVAEVYFDPDKPLTSVVTSERLWGDVNSMEREKFRRETASVIAGISDSFDRAWRLCQWTRAQCRVIGPDLERTHSRWEQLQGMRAGKGALCGPLAFVLRESLVANGIPARVILLMRDPPFHSDGHAAVEAYVNHDWVFLDPTFNAYFRVDGRPASAWELREAFFYAQSPIEPVEAPLPLTRNRAVVSYGPTIGTYYINYFVQLNEILYQYYESSLALRYGLIRYPYLKLLQTPFVHLVRPGNVDEVRYSPFRIHNILLNILYIWLPTLFLICSALLFLSLRTGRPPDTSHD